MREMLKLGLKALVVIFLLGQLPASARAAPPLSVYGSLPGFEMAAISHSGDHVALIGVVEGQRRLLVLDRKKDLKLVVQLGDVKIWGIDWAGDQYVIVRTSATVGLGVGFVAEKVELTSATVIALAGKKPWVVFDKSRLITGGIRGFYGLTERGGKWYGYFGGITLESDGKSEPWLKSTKPVLYEVDLATRNAKSIARRAEDGEWRSWLMGADGKVGATLQYLSKIGKWTLFDGDNHSIATGKNLLGDIDLVGFGQKPETVIYSDKDPASSDVQWYEISLGGGAATEVLPDEDVGRSFFDSRSRRLIGYRKQGDMPTYRFFNSRHDKIAAAVLKAFPGLSVHLIDWNDTMDRLIVTTEGVGDPGTWWLVDIKTGGAEVLGISYAIGEKDVGPMRMIRYKASDGLEIAAVLTLPPGLPAKNLPVVIFPHGGPRARDYPIFDWWAQAFASRGYAVLQPNFRGSTGYGAAFEKAGHGEWGRKMQSDVSEGLAQLVKDGIADSKRACIMGASYGGYAALAGVTLQQGLYRCAVSVAGVSDVYKMVQTDMSESGGNATMRRSLKAEVGSGRDLSDVSPIRFAAKADAPVLLVHGKDDTVVLYDQSNDMAQALRKAGKPVEFVTLPGGDHWLAQSATRRAMLEAAVAFVEKHNPADVQAQK